MKRKEGAVARGDPAPWEPAPPPGQTTSRQAAEAVDPPLLSSQAAARVLRRMRRIFARLDGVPYLGPEERREFRRYKAIMEESLAAIDARVARGELRVPDLAGFPQILRFPALQVRAGVFIGSFDPFQMTHLCTALRFLASPRCAADFVIVVPEGSAESAKPGRSAYRFRYELLRRQLEGVFDPFIVPLDIGDGADTIGIVERLVSLHPAARLSLTHLLGSDSLPRAIEMLDQDLEVWRARAARCGVDFELGLFVALREALADPGAWMGEAAKRGVRLEFEPGVDLGCGPSLPPSSTDFRSGRALTVVFPTDAVLARLELLFRYRMNQPWPYEGPSASPESPGNCEI